MEVNETMAPVVDNKITPDKMTAVGATIATGAETAGLDTKAAILAKQRDRMRCKKIAEGREDANEQ